MPLDGDHAAPSAAIEPPYPAETAARGWRLDFDVDRMLRSDTWALAPLEVRPWLFQIPAIAWLQVPCGSLPAEERLLASRLGMPLRFLQKHRAVLLRGWDLASDGRLYHSVLSEHVMEMERRKKFERDRKARHRARQRQVDPASVPWDSGGTDADDPREFGGTDATDTDTDTDTKKESAVIPPPSRAPAPARAREDGEGEQESRPEDAADEALCRRLRGMGLSDAVAADPRLRTLRAQGYTDAELVNVGQEAVKKGKGWPWVLATVVGRRADAAGIALVPGAPSTPWWESRSGVEGKARELGLAAWDEEASQQGRGKHWPAYRESVLQAAGDGPWRQAHAAPAQAAGSGAQRAGALVARIGVRT